jgi:hypothetical protein
VRSRCRSCGAPIVWAETEAGRRMPVDADTDPDGNVLVVPDPVTGELVALIDSEAKPLAKRERTWPEGTRHRSHFATCPNASTHRKKVAP